MSIHMFVLMSVHMPIHIAIHEATHKVIRTPMRMFAHMPIHMSMHTFYVHVHRHLLSARADDSAWRTVAAARRDLRPSTIVA